MRIGFTGSREGMTNAQVLHVHMLLGDLRWLEATQVSHGMCVGSDVQFHEMAKALGYFIVGCPGTIYSEPWQRANVTCDLVMPEKPMLMRNGDIVRESDVMIATPKQMKESIRSGTWTTVRYARYEGKPLCILYPDGTSTVEGVPGVTTAEAWRALMVQKAVAL